MFMMSHIQARWEHVRASFWFLPALLALAGSLLAELLLAVDRAIPDTLLVNSRLIISAGASEQRAILFGLAGVTVGTAGVVFSLTTVPLSIAASQFGSRLLRAFLSDPPTQLVMGCFTATVVYCISVGLSIPADPQSNQLPYLATTASVLLFGISFGSVIYLINHLGVMLQAPVITERISRFLKQAIHAYTTLGARMGSVTPEEAQLREQVAGVGMLVIAARGGYVDAVDGLRLVQLACHYESVILVRAMPGAFVMEGDVLAMVWPAERHTAEVSATIGGCFLLSVQRSLVQDVGFGINQLVEIALRALSPAINDPLTVMNCLDRLGDSLRLLADGAPPPALLRDRVGGVRVFLTLPSFADLVEGGLGPIRQYGRDSALVLQRLVEVIAAVTPYAHRPEDRAALARQLELVAETGEAGLPTESERLALRRRLREVKGLLDTLQTPLTSRSAVLGKVSERTSPP
ncbi:MAG: DUF2254 domain-containing protein [Chloroflexales bacterium]|nr:DUF2254 domain-containing protein [Chloroflexales bacterium]